MSTMALQSGISLPAGRWRVLHRGSLAVVLSLAAIVTGYAAPARAELGKIGWFDLNQIIAESAEAGELKKRLQAEVDQKQHEFDQLQQDLQAKAKDLESKKDILSPAALQQAQAELNSQIQAAEKRGLAIQQQLQSSRQTAFGEMLGRMEPIVQKIAADGGYAYVFEKNQSGLLIAPAEHDLTSELLRKVNAASRARKEGKISKAK